MRRVSTSAGIALLCVFLLNACADTRAALGLEKESPDEFAVFSRAPLSLPPDFGLRPPTPGRDRPQNVMPRDDAVAALAGPSGAKAPGSTTTLASAPASTGGTDGGPGLQSLLRQLGAERTDPQIRNLVNRETAILAADSVRVADRIIFWRDREPFGTVVDPTKEDKRIQEARALGRPLNEGEVPTISKKKGGLFDQLF